MLKCTIISSQCLDGDFFERITLIVRMSGWEGAGRKGTVCGLTIVVNHLLHKALKWEQILTVC